ncbi:MAG: DNA oxidative demethylase AlkB [Actinobacteria bacterium]|nr:DNA oxidative demethylase AlkB [Actinomycetota bacterium]
MLFSATDSVEVAPGVVLFRGAVESAAEALLSEIEQIVAVSPLRRVMTPMGKPMSVEMTNCGSVGWVSDRMGYRYESIDPVTNQPWPTMPALFADAATEFASLAGYRDFVPDVCLINRYSPGSKMGLHQDRDENDFSQPIVSVSLGLPITFKIGGQRRTDPTVSTKLQHGDVVVFGGPARLAFHGVGTLRRGTHPLTGANRYNLTIRCV